MARKNHYIDNSQVKQINLRREIQRYLKNWYWFILGIIICLVTAYFYLRYTTPVYNAKASIIINKDAGIGTTSLGSGLDALEGGGSNNLDNELGILKSRRLLTDVVKSLNLNVEYFKEGKVRTVEIYDDVPFDLQVLRWDEDKLKDLGGKTYAISMKNGYFKITEETTQKTFTAKTGTQVKLDFADIVLFPKDSKNPSSEAVITKFRDIQNVASKYRNKISLNQISKSSGLIELELKDPVKQKARDILDQLVLEFNRSAIEDKNLIAGNTANFINERLAIINGELDSVETGKESFKERNRLTDLQAQSQMFMQNANEYNKRIKEVATQLELSNAMLGYITNNNNSELLPSNLGIAEGGINAQIGEYNNLVLERNRILSGSSEKNPVVMGLNSKIIQIRENVVQSLRSLQSTLRIEEEDLNRQAASIGSQIYSVPSKEREFRGIERQQNIKETLYLFLLQKREENSLSLAITEPKAKVVDRAFSSGLISPNSRSIYLGSFIMGLFIPFSVIYIKGAMDDKVRKREDVENFAKDVGLVGLLPKVSSSSKIIGRNDRSVLAESFRILVTNLQYLLVSSRHKKHGFVLFITSTIKGEGKTFTAANLAVTLANTGKKVLLMGVDLRNPKLQKFSEGKDRDLGVSDYLINDGLQVSDLIFPSNLHPEMDIITSGIIPPNPFELLKQDKIGDLFKEVEKMYDFVVVDTAPSMLVADTLLLTKHADLILYIVRSGYTEKELLNFPIVSREEGKLKNVSFVLNDVKATNLGYGNKYSYGYEQEKKKFWRNQIPVRTA